MPRTRGDGKLHITYNEMGQGDNILIACPNGKVVVIDCGSARWDTKYFDLSVTPEVLREQAIRIVFDNCFLGTNQMVNALILTHADKDHCNELASVFDHTLTDGTSKVSEICAVYFSDLFGSYIEGAANFYLLNKTKPENRYAITINATDQKINDSAIESSPKNTAEINKKSSRLETQGFIKIIDGTEDKLNALPCNVYILASNVKTYPNIQDGYPNETPEGNRNRGSVVTMIIYGDKKFLFMGDATFHTEKFLKDTYGAKIQNLEFLHIGHHASYRTSSSYSNDPKQAQRVKNIDFIRHVNPRYLAVTAAYDSGSSLKLPRWETINNYIQGAAGLLNKLGTLIHCWEYHETEYIMVGKKRQVSQPKSDKLNDKITNKYILCTGTHGALDFDYKEHDDGSGRKARAYKLEADETETLLP
ncbi:MAG TPA: hypothetical protein DCS91_03730 [Microcoleaceae bacterium UBA11344]|jgi:Predicted hydrolase (metallo-beta-lactamase superfamily)|nr:hypothetical protein [Microcoleaceae cyanobacterium UBA11344]